jgi:hypothetical protein
MNQQPGGQIIGRSKPPVRSIPRTISPEVKLTEGKHGLSAAGIYFGNTRRYA